MKSTEGRFPEMNALEVNPQGQGVGTKLIEAAEHLAGSVCAATIGLAVEQGNVRARRLYDRLGYRHWRHGTVIDEWAQRDDDGNVMVVHRDECNYLVKRLAAR